MPWPVSGAGRDDFRFAAPLAGREPVFGHLGQDAIGVDTGQIDLVHGHDDRHAGRFGVTDRLFGLRHDAVVGRDDQHGDVGDVRPAGPHFGEGFVTGRVDKRDGPAVFLDLVGADVLRDAARFAGHHVGADEVVEQRGLAVIDVAQERDDRRSRLEFLGRVLGLADLGDQRVLQRFVGLEFQVDAQLGGQHFDVFVVDDRVDGQHLPHAHQRLLDLHGADAGGFRKTADSAGEFQSDFSFPRSGGVGAFVDQRLAFARVPEAPIPAG